MNQQTLEVCPECLGRSVQQGGVVCPLCLGTGRIAGSDGLVYIPRPEAVTLTREQYDQLISNNSAQPRST